MGDRTYVCLYVPAELYEQAKEIAIEHDGKPVEENTAGKAVHFMGFEEVNYGELNCIKELQSAGIPYDMDWAEGSSYEEGVQYCRFTETGDLKLKTINGSDYYIYPSVLEKVIEEHNSLDAVKDLLKRHHEAVDPPSWDNQVEYGKMYRIKQLIAGNTTQLVLNT
ncbi:hypothetical protein [Stutzerimonas stutzeri]|uniref:Uncharacterized protein n=1 Tax=Stutzerimonas stutzeri TaxID=316 RepID=A0AA42PAZ0_STUST|nr:hypothetical protein [Stutzerimonas stutzeri]MDH1236507.1 hypothetical protein [Stutzerimonas stutzeri]